MATNGIFCLEGDWNTRLDDPQSMKPVLDLLNNSGWAKVIHRGIGTRGDFEYYVSKWAAKRYKSYTVGAFAFHGTSEALHVGEDTMTLEDFQRVLAGKCQGRVLYMGACKTLATADKTLMELCQVTGASAVAGYTKDVDFLEAAAFEALLLSDLVGAVRMKPAYQRMITRYHDLTAHLGFRMATSSWASP
jgi:hypothetical protein